MVVFGSKLKITSVCVDSESTLTPSRPFYGDCPGVCLI